MVSNLKYYAKQSLGMLFFECIYAVLLITINASPNENPLTYISMIMLTSFVCTIIFSITMYKRDIPLAISFCQKRSYIFIGTISLAIWAYIFCVIACLAIVGIFEININLSVIAIFSLLLVMTANALGVLLGICWNRFGKAVALVSIFLISGICGGLSAIGIIGSENAGSISKISFNNGLNGNSWLIFTVLIFWAIAMAVHHYAIMNYKFAS